MSPARTVAIALSAAILAAPAGALAQGSSGAGDEQYADPFEGAPAQTRPQTTTGSQTGGEDNGLSQAPDLGTGAATPAPGPSGTGTGTGTAPHGTTVSAGTLPMTGSDPGLLILAGLALLLTGFGLRLRTADEVF